MIKNRLKKVLLAGIFLGTVLTANSSNYMYNGYSMLAIEGGYSDLAADITDLSDNPGPYEQLNGASYNLGMKIGAQTGHYRVFLSARTYKDSDDNFDYLTTYGIEGQYLFYMFDWVDFFIGAGGGLINAKFNDKSEAYARTINDPYFSGEMGFNIHSGEWMDFELGARYVSMDAANLQENEIEYRLNDMISAYASVIFKFKMD